jgi:hypothetical protein
MTDATNSSNTPLTQRDVASLHNIGIAIRSKMEPIHPPVAVVKLNRLVRKPGGSYQPAFVRERSGVQVSVNARPSRFWPAGKSLPANVFVRELFDVASDPFRLAPDELVWEMAAKAATESRLSPNEALTLARGVSALLGSRCGLAVPTAGDTP